MSQTGEPCATHAEFVRRLDDRWNQHQDQHREDESAHCDKFKRIFDSLDRVNSKLNWVLGGLAVTGPLLVIFMQLLISHLQGAPK